MTDSYNQTSINLTGVGSNIVSVKDFGAVGDGNHDDTAAIAAAFASDPGTLLFPPGNYKTTSNIIISDNVVIFGYDATITSTDVSVAFSVRCSEFEVNGLSFDSNAIVFDGTNSPAFDRIKFFQCNFSNAVDPIFIGNTASGSVLIQDADINSCSFVDVTYGMRITTRNARHIRVRGCYIDNTLGHGILIGSDVYASQDDMREYIVDSNVLSNIGDDVLTTGCKGIIVFGTQVVISNNTVREVHAQAGMNAEGIYTKARFAAIVGNSLYNASQGEGAITAKGAARGAVSNVQGYGVLIADNQIFNDRAIVDATGIRTSAGESVIVSNNIEGAVFYGIHCGDENGGKLVVCQNKIYNTSGVAGIWLASETGNIICDGNNIIDTQEDVAGDSSGIVIRNTWVNPAENISICNNLISGVTATTVESGIRLWGDPAPSFNNIHIDGNIIEDCSSGIYLNGATKYGPMVIEHNQFYSVATPVVNSYTVASTIIRRNNGFLTEAHGEATINAGTSVVVIHGLARFDNKPGRIQITPTGDITPAVTFWISNVNDTDFTINVDNATTATFSWTISSDDKTV